MKGNLEYGKIKAFDYKFFTCRKLLSELGPVYLVCQLTAYHQTTTTIEINSKTYFMSIHL